jgi:hypothetical protein
MHGDFLCCGACKKKDKKASYCSKDCQKKHWKQIHKNDCKKKSGCKVDHNQIKQVANILTKNYAQTVHEHTGQHVTEKQKKAAFPGLVKLCRDFAETRPDLNSNHAFGDSGKDPECNFMLAKYFSQQSGYEYWGRILQHPNYRENIQKQAIPSSVELFDEETVVEFANRFMAIAFHAYSHLDIFQPEPLLEKIIACLKEYILSHPEHNSFGGFLKLEKSKELKELVGQQIVDFMEALQGE